MDDGDDGDAAIARLMMEEEYAAADAAGLDYSPSMFSRRRRRGDDSESDEYSPRRGVKRAAKPKPKPPPKPSPKPKPKKERPPAKAPSGGASGVTLAHLIDANLIAPGVDVVSTLYNGVTELATLRDDGAIAWDGREFHSVSAFSLAVKRRTNPDRKADDGWKCVKCDGVALDAVKRRYEATVAAGGAEGAEDAAGDGAIVKPGGAVELAMRKARDAKDAAAREREASKPPPPPPKPKPAKVSKPKPPKVSKPPRDPKAPPPPPPPPRPQRARRAASSRGPLPGAHGPNGDLQMVECEKHPRGTQPWTQTLSPAAATLMDFHAHLCGDEIIGFLGGTFDADAKTLKITRALPARRLTLKDVDGADAAVEVELDPESVPDIVDALDEDGLRVVGWYHSHPVFSTHPSLRDIENQANYQFLFKDGPGPGPGPGGGDGKGGGSGSPPPFVGCIVGPYDQKNVSESSDIRWFHVVDDDGGETRGGVGGAASAAARAATGEAAGRPFELECAASEDAALPPNVLLDLRKLADAFGDGDGERGDGDGAGAERADRVDLTSHWRDGVSKLAKLRASLSSRLPRAWGEDMRMNYVGGVLRYLEHKWGIASTT